MTSPLHHDVTPEPQVELEQLRAENARLRRGVKNAEDYLKLIRDYPIELATFEGGLFDTHTDWESLVLTIKEMASNGLAVQS